MPLFRPTSPWEAKPHTPAKIEIVRRYVFLWFQILGRTGISNRLVYIDGFAGPGVYSNHPEGSPIVALKAAQEAQATPGSGLSAKECCFLFVEKKPDFAESLKATVAQMVLPKNFKWEVRAGEFAEVLTEIVDPIQQQGQTLAPTFAFLDPFGATGLPFKAVADILSFPTCEVLLNLDSDGIGRLLAVAKIEKNQQHLTSLFGDDSWRQQLDPRLSMSQLSAQVLALYKKKLISLPKVRYRFAFAMNSRDGQLNYHLVFASQNPKGLEKMKEAMRAVDRSGMYSFSDDTVGQALLPFNYADPEPWARRMQQALGGRPRSYNEFHDFALNETPFLNPKELFKCLKKASKLEVQWLGEPAKSGFPEEKIRTILLKP